MKVFLEGDLSSVPAEHLASLISCSTSQPGFVLKMSVYLKNVTGCDLISVFIPPSCREIGGYAFGENKNLTIFNVSQHTAIGEDIIKRAKLLQDSHFELNERGYYHNQSEEVNNWLKNMNILGTFCFPFGMKMCENYSAVLKNHRFRMMIFQKYKNIYNCNVKPCPIFVKPFPL